MVRVSRSTLPWHTGGILSPTVVCLTQIPAGGNLLSPKMTDIRSIQFGTLKTHTKMKGLDEGDRPYRSGDGLWHDDVSRFSGTLTVDSIASNVTKRTPLFFFWRVVLSDESDRGGDENQGRETQLGSGCRLE